jgi:transcriptional regulator with XRE-family HTH domain
MREQADAPEGDVTARIAERVRSLRSARGLTLDELAERAGVSRAMLSRIERGESSPTAVILDRVASGLNTSLASLFDVPTSIAPLHKHAQQVSWRDPASGYVRRNLSPPGIDSPLQLVEVTFPARTRVAYDSPPRAGGVDQQVWMLAGAIEIGVGDAQHLLSEGDCLAMRLDLPVYFHNKSKSAARYLVATVTGTGKRSTV